MLRLAGPKYRTNSGSTFVDDRNEPQSLMVQVEYRAIRTSVPKLIPTISPIANVESGVPAMPYWRLFTGEDGLSSVAASFLDGFTERSVGGEAAAMWMLAAPGTVEAVRFAVLPVGWVGEWHESPAMQLVVTLSGRWFIETQDGLRIEMGPGDIHWGEDLGTRPVNGNHGHRSGQLGDCPCAQMLVQFRAVPKTD